MGVLHPGWAVVPPTGLGSPGGARSRVEERDAFDLDRTAAVVIVHLPRGSLAQG